MSEPDNPYLTMQAELSWAQRSFRERGEGAVSDILEAVLAYLVNVELRLEALELEAS